MWRLESPSLLRNNSVGVHPHRNFSYLSNNMQISNYTHTCMSIFFLLQLQFRLPTENFQNRRLWMHPFLLNLVCSHRCFMLTHLNDTKTYKYLIGLYYIILHVWRPAIWMTHWAVISSVIPSSKMYAKSYIFNVATFCCQERWGHLYFDWFFCSDVISFAFKRIP